MIKKEITVDQLQKRDCTPLVSVGHLCDLRVLFSEIDNLHTVNRIE